MISWRVSTKFRIRESGQFKTLLELYDMEIHQQISMSSWQKLKFMVKRSTDPQRQRCGQESKEIDLR